MSAAKFIRQELSARGWSKDDLARRMSWRPARFRKALDILLDNPDPHILLDPDTAKRLERALNLPEGYLIRLDDLWRSTAPSRMSSASAWRPA